MRKQQKILNLFQKENISTIRHTFSIADEDDLDQCWDYFQNYHYESSKNLHTFIALFYEFSNQFILHHNQNYFELILETDDSHFYLTIRNKKISMQLHDFLKDKELDYLFNDKRVSICIKKSFDNSLKMQTDQKRNESILNSLTQTKSKRFHLPPYDFMQADDLEDLLALCEDLEDILLISKKIGLVEKLFIRLRSCFSIFSLTLRSYPQLNSVATTITTFSALINTNQERFSQLDVDEIIMIEGFIYNIQRWLQALFVQGGVELSFMDNSLNADLSMIENIISPKELAIANEEDLETIFNF
jgi:hypothetical protein